MVQFAGKFMPRFGLFLFIVAVPLMLAAYPAYIVSSHLKAYAAAQPVVVKLTGFEIDTLEDSDKEPGFFDSRKHVEVTFSFKSIKGESYTSAIRKSWPAPGLKRKLSERYAVDDELKIYLLADKSVVMEEVVAREVFLRLFILMGLLFLFSSLSFLIWKRLAARMKDTLAVFPDAIFKSVVYGQLGSLLLAAMVTGVIFIKPVVVPASWFLGAYLGLAALMILALRLLVFAQPLPAVVEVEEEKPPKSLRPA